MAMCRSIKTLRRPDEAATTGELEAAARQYVRKISGYRVPVGAERRRLRRRDRRDRRGVGAADGDPRRRRRGRTRSLDAAFDGQRGHAPPRLASCSGPRSGERAPVDHALDRDLDDWARLEPVARVLPISGPKRRDRSGMLLPGGRWRHERRPAIHPQPGEARPVLIPAIDQDGHRRIGLDVADTREGQRVAAPFRLVVERRVEDRPDGIEGRGRRARGAAGHRARWSPGLRDERPEGRPAGRR